MANPVVSLITNNVAVHGAGPQFIPFSVVFSSTAYATPTGITVDLTSILATRGVAPSSAQGFYGAGVPGGGSTRLAIDWTDVLDIITGTYSGGDTVVATKSATYGQVTVRLWNGETETADGAKTGTLKLLIPVMQGSHSWQAA